jgi:beta-glucanase (GH16 family)
MKKTLKNFGKFLVLLVFAAGCQEDDKTFGDIVTPSNLEITYSIVGKDLANPNGDGSGKVNFTATADNVLNYKYTFSDDSEASAPSGAYTKQFTQNGVHTYTVTVIAYGTGGASTSKSVQVTVFSNFSDPVIEQFLTGGSSKTWYWAAATQGHLGVGPNNNDAGVNFWPNYYGAGPFEKAGSPESSCIYNAKFTFTKDGDFIRFLQDNGGQTFFNASYNSVGGSSATTDQCLTYNTTEQKTVTLAPSNSVVAPEKSTKVEMIFSNGGFMGYYIGATTYEILEITNTKMVVRAVMGNNPSLAWYHTFSTTPPFGGSNDPDYTNLVWFDEFDVNGAPNPLKWTYDLGNNNGWGNSELQTYTQSPSNVIVDGGVLKITAKKEGSGYTSARLKTEGLYKFTYGKVEVRAKLPAGAGTWPAIWMLGANYSTPGNAWPASGEIDIMEQKGFEPTKIHATLHYPGNSGGNANTNVTTVANTATEFHVYSVIWSPTTIKFYVDGVQFHSFNNSAAVPFNHDFFLILNVAMGGTFGGPVDPAFTQSTMEVDYVKVYRD